MGVRVTGGAELAAKLEEQAARVRDPSVFLAAEARELEELLAETAAAGRAPDGEAWAPRVQASRDARTGRARPRRDTRVGRILDRTGLLRASELVRVVGTTLVVENGAPYARFIQQGTKWMRARRIIPTAASGGPVGEWLSGFSGRLARFVVTGRA